MLGGTIRKLITDGISSLKKEGTLSGFNTPEFSVEASENPAHGDYATNAAMAMAKLAKKPPMEIAERLAAIIGSSGQGIIERVAAVKPGFTNFFLTDTYLLGGLFMRLEEKDGGMSVADWDGTKVMVEFTDPNPFKEFHIGHLYSNIVGESLSRILEAAGATVKRANYQGDVGLHVAKALWGMQRKLTSAPRGLAELEQQSLEERMKFLGQAYVEGAVAFDADEGAKKEMVELNKKIFALDPGIRDLYEKGRAWSLEYFERIYRRLGTKFDFYYFERDVGETGAAIVREHLARGVFRESDGAIVFPGEKYGLHRRVFINSEGLPTYEAKELGLAPTKYKDFPYDLSVVVTGSEIIEYFKVLLAALKEINPSLAEKTRHVAHGMVRLATGKMSSRSGEVMRAEDLLNEVRDRVLGIMETSESELEGEERREVAEQVAVGAVRYSLLRVGVGKDIVFDVDTSLNLEGDSGPYLQYTHARLKSILRKAAKDAKETKVTKVPGEVELDDVEHRLLATTLRLPEVIEDALKSFMPNTIAAYLNHLAKLANGFYHSHPVIQEPDETKRHLRVALVSGVALTLAKGLNLLGIAAPEEM